MTGPEHFGEAQKMLAESRVPARERATPGWLTADELVASAAVHATLALAAATALQSDLTTGQICPDRAEWLAVASNLPVASIHELKDALK